MTRYLIAVASALAAANAVLQSYPGDIISQDIIVAGNVLAVFMGGLAYMLAKPAQ